MRNYKDYLIESLQDPEEAKVYLQASIEAYLEDNNIEALMLAFEYLSKAQGVEIKMPNKETLKAMQEAENDINMTECTNADDMFKKLGI